MKRRLAYQLCYVIAAMGALSGAAQAAGIATIQDVTNEGYRTPPGADETGAKPADELVQNEALRTEEESTIQVKFVDGSELSVEASSEVVLSDYVFDGSASTGLINLNDGLFHFTSNGNNDQGVKLRTPVATIGVRGTEFLVHVDGDQVTIVDILEGQVEAIPHGSGQPIICEGGQSILIAGPDEDAMCGDIGSFSTAAGPSGGDGEGGGNGGDTNKDRDPTSRPPKPEPPAPPSEDPDTGCEGGDCGSEGGSGSGSEGGSGSGSGSGGEEEVPTNNFFGPSQNGPAGGQRLGMRDDLLKWDYV
ncbi:MAG TPA: FecR family protein [Dongiaceae bacterium]|nr:FecR family protein [Dongiaceae bacterium]